MKHSAIFFLAILVSALTPAYAGECKNHIVPSTIENATNGEVSKYIDALKGTVLFSDAETPGSYCHLKNWYEERMSSRQFSSRILAVLIIVLGASLPLIVILENTFKNQKFWIAFIGAAIVIGQGFSQTFQYEESWRSYTVAKLELEGAHREWQKRIINAAMASNGLQEAKSATDSFSESVSKIVLKETTGFFDSVSESMKSLTNSSSGAPAKPAPFN